MRAAVFDRYGPPEVLRVAAVERPTPRPNEVLVEVHATTVNRTDCGFRDPEPFFVRFFSGLVRPKRRVLGTEFAGAVAAIGAEVTQFRDGDRVFGVNANEFGAHAEFLCVRESAPIATMPENTTFSEAAPVCDGGIIALTCLRRADVKSGQNVLVYGASGSIGTAAVQLAKTFGATVTAVCNTKNLEVVKSIGADKVVDYTRDDFTVTDETYDVVFDAVGKVSFRRCRDLIVPGGWFITTDLGVGWHVPFLALATRVVGRKHVTLPIPRYNKENVTFLKGLVEDGKYRAVIDRTYPLEQIVEATRYVETKQKTGNVVLNVQPDD